MIKILTLLAISATFTGCTCMVEGRAGFKAEDKCHTCDK